MTTPRARGMVGHGWALSVALTALPYYRRTNPVPASVGRCAIADVLAVILSDVLFRPRRSA